MFYCFLIFAVFRICIIKQMRLVYTFYISIVFLNVRHVLSVTYTRLKLRYLLKKIGEIFMHKLYA